MKRYNPNNSYTHTGSSVVLCINKKYIQLNESDSSYLCGKYYLHNVLSMVPYVKTFSTLSYLEKRSKLVPLFLEHFILTLNMASTNRNLFNIMYVCIILKWKSGKKYVLTCEIFFTIYGILLYTANVVLIWFPLQNPFLFSNKVLLLNNVIVTIELCVIVCLRFE